MLQKDAKIIFISSTNSSDQATSFLYRLKDAHERLLNVVSYVCDDHREEFDMQDSMVACPCFRLRIPCYITLDINIRTTTNLFLEGAFSTELMGDATSIAEQGLSRIIGEEALTQLELCRVNTLEKSVVDRLGSTLYVYIDPAYTNNTSASGTGIAAVTLARHNPTRVVILGLEHFFLKDLTGDASLQIATCTQTLISSIVSLHPHLTEVRVAVEGNSSQDAAVAIATILDDICNLPCLFVHTQDKASNLHWPMYLLTGEKSKAFEAFIYAVNTASISASQVITSNTIQLSYDPISYLVSQIKAIKSIPLRDGTYTYTGKQKNLSDDVLVSLVLVHYLAVSQKHTFRKITG
ncbi:ORF20 [callitrichine gammaherpesvirus 3]|uniref:ORF20 n=1 Tax=callitrichine gammaherpesvirus 3 TaxID=106331 RepID=Q993J0_9GAMA|nr:ORF20 [callitrichine gammaherpesvirus 3]AAK38228.1 ORF20 [callitrichine gammaherpesvirus 3]